MSVVATLLTLMLAFPIAWIIAKFARGRASSLLFILCLIPFWVSETVRTLGWMILLRESGVLPALLVKLGITAVPVEMLYHDATILVGLVYTSLLFMVDAAGLEPGEPGQFADRGGLRSRRERLRRCLRTIVIPHAAPGITAGCIVVFMLTLGNYLTPTLLGGKNSQWFTEQIYTQFITRFNWEQGAAFGFLLLGLSTALVVIGLRLAGQRFGDVMRQHMIPSLPRPVWLRTATLALFGRVSRIPVPAADRRRGVRVQQRAVSRSAVARLHARLVPRQRSIGAHRAVRRLGVAGQHLDQLRRRRLGHACSRC